MGEPSHIVAAHLTERDNRLRDRQLPTWAAFEDYKVAVDLAEFAMRRRTTSTLPSLEALDRLARCCERRAYIQQ